MIVSEDKIKHLFCPNTDKIQEIYKIKNGYGDPYERVSFSLDVYRCNPSLRSCKNEDETKFLFDHLQFTINEIQE